METRKPYEKPKLNQVKLVPQETMLSGCKTPSGAGGRNSACTGTACKKTTGS
jgi:hypothetical protein